MSKTVVKPTVMAMELDVSTGRGNTVADRTRVQSRDGTVTVKTPAPDRTVVQSDRTVVQPKEHTTMSKTTVDTNPTTDVASLHAQIAALQAQNAALEKAKHDAANKRLTMKVSEKGGLSVYGLGRFPVTLYSSQWDRLLGFSDEIRKFIDANRDKLITKEAAAAKAAESK